MRKKFRKTIFVQLLIGIESAINEDANCFRETRIYSVPLASRVFKSPNGEEHNGQVHKIPGAERPHRRESIYIPRLLTHSLTRSKEVRGNREFEMKEKKSRFTSHP